MDSFVNRESLRKELVSYAVCMYQPMLMSRERVMTVVDEIPEGIVRCRDCQRQQGCKLAQRLGEDGYCSEGERRE